MRLLWTIALLVLARPLVSGQQTYDAPHAEEVLQRLRERLLPDLERLPRYTCVQTITRRYYRPRSGARSCATLMAAHDEQKEKAALGWWDRLRLEVGVVEGENVFSWVGAPRFEKGMLEQIGGSGPLGSGDFGPFLHSILRQASVTFTGEMRADNRRLLAYTYDIPVTSSRYMVRTATGWTATAYTGEFVIDPEVEDIVSLTVRTTELPKSTPDCQAISEVDYGRTAIHDRKILIPRETRLAVIARDGSETRNVTEYASCREYTAKSRILLQGFPGGNGMQPVAPGAAPSAETMASAAAPMPAPAVVLPDGQHFQARIMTPIDSDQAAAGDPVELVLKSPIRDRNHAVLAPAGAHLHARMTGMEEHGGFYFRISLKFESIELKGATVPLRAKPDNSIPTYMSVPATAIWVSSQASNEEVTNMSFRRQHVHLETFDWGWTTLAAAAAKEGKVE